jgi:ankyrin repeat protein
MRHLTFSVLILIHGAVHALSPLPPRCNSDSPWLAAVADRDLAKVHDLANSTTVQKEGTKALWMAVTGGLTTHCHHGVPDEALFALLLKLGADVNGQVTGERAGNGPLMTVIAEKGSLGMARMAIAAGAKLDQPPDQPSPLLAAIGKSRTEMVGLLLDEGAAPNRQNGSTDSLTPLQVAASHPGPRSGTLQLLIRQGARCPSELQIRDPVLIFATSYLGADEDADEALRLLLLGGCDKGTLWSRGGPQTYSTLEPALREAVKQAQSLAVIRALLRRGADPNDGALVDVPCNHNFLKGKNREILKLLHSYGARLSSTRDFAILLRNASVCEQSKQQLEELREMEGRS